MTCNRLSWRDFCVHSIILTVVSFRRSNKWFHHDKFELKRIWTRFQIRRLEITRWVSIIHSIFNEPFSRKTDIFASMSPTPRSSPPSPSHDADANQVFIAAPLLTQEAIQVPLVNSSTWALQPQEQWVDLGRGGLVVVDFFVVVLVQRGLKIDFVC